MLEESVLHTEIENTSKNGGKKTGNYDKSCIMDHVSDVRISFQMTHKHCERCEPWQQAGFVN